jgi:hypothetical protein
MVSYLTEILLVQADIAIFEVKWCYTWICIKRNNLSNPVYEMLLDIKVHW